MRRSSPITVDEITPGIGIRAGCPERVAAHPSRHTVAKAFESVGIDTEYKMEAVPILEAEIEIVRKYYAALNRNDIAEIVSGFDPEIEWVEPADSPGSGVYRGLDTVRDHIERARNTWAEGTCEPERFITAGDSVIAFDKVHVRLKTESEWREGSIAAVYTFRNGRIVRGRVFFDRQQALDWAGAGAMPAT